MAPPIAIPTVAPTVAATPTFLRRVGTRVVDFFVPEFLRREYRRIIASLCKFKYAYIALAASILFAVAEYEQPGYLPRHQELTLALLGFLGASALIFPAFAFIEYGDTHTWPWEDEGFVWPWEALLWSGTVYCDETMGDSVAAYRNMNRSSPPAWVDGGGYPRESQSAMSGTNGASTMATSTRGYTTPAGSPAQPDMIIPPTPLLPGGLRPISLTPPSMHHSGLLGESPVPIKFKHFSGHSDLEGIDEE